MIDYVSWWKDMQDAGHYVYTGVQRDWDGTYNAFASQQVPFLIYSSSDTTLLTNEGETGGFTVEASFMPGNADRPDGGGNIIGGATLWLVDGLDEGRRGRGAGVPQLPQQPGERRRLAPDDRVHPDHQRLDRPARGRGLVRGEPELRRRLGAARRGARVAGHRRAC
jgi:hypothetical protein